MVLQNHLTILLHKNKKVKNQFPLGELIFILYKNTQFREKVAKQGKMTRFSNIYYKREGYCVILFVLSTAIILLFVLFTLYYYIAGKKEVPHHQLLEEEFEREE